MKKITVFLSLIFLLLVVQTTFAQDVNDNQIHKLSRKEIKEIDNTLNSRLNFTPEQKVIIRANHTEFIKKMDKIISKMEELRIQIRNIYYTGIPKWQADIKTAPLKAELVLLKQNADKIREENRKNFINILDANQKIEFQKIRKELKQNK